MHEMERINGARVIVARDISVHVVSIIKLHARHKNKEMCSYLSPGETACNPNPIYSLQTTNGPSPPVLVPFLRQEASNQEDLP